MRFLNIFNYNLLLLLIWLLFWYDNCFKADTHSYKFFPRIINIYSPTSTMCTFWLLLPKNDFQKGDWALASVSTQFEIFLIPSWSQVSSLWDFSFGKSFLQNSAVMLSCFEDLLFIWQSLDLEMLWHFHPIFQNGGRKF